MATQFTGMTSDGALTVGMPVWVRCWGRRLYRIGKG